MSPGSQRLLFALGLLLAVGVPLGQIAFKERVLRDGQPVLLELAPVDPRSLIQGDYMRLDYAIARAAGRQTASAPEWPTDGHLVVTLDEHQVATLVRRDDGRSLGPGELRLRYRRRRHQIRVGSDAFYFQEGHARRYEGARYGEVRLTGTGESVLRGLRDAQRRPLGGQDEPRP